MAWQLCLDERWVPPLLALAAFNLDFLCIHPCRDGNRRVSRLLWLLQSAQLGYEVGRDVVRHVLREQQEQGLVSCYRPRGGRHLVGGGW